MKKVILYLLIFSSIHLVGQTAADQAVYKQKIWKAVKLSAREHAFYDQSDNYLGSKVKSSVAIVYRDKWKRELKRIPLKTQKKVQQTGKKNAAKKPGVKIAPTAARIDLKRNKAIYYDAKGNVLRTIRRRGNKMIFHDNKGKIVGYKYYNGNGTYTYQDSKRRLTGTSYINNKGVLIFTPYRRRVTKQFMLDDPFFMRR